MKKFLLSLSVGALLGFTSCEKCSECSCTSEYAFEFSSNIDPATQTILETAYTNEFDEDYPEYSEELCTKRGQHKDSIAAFEDQSYQISEDNQFLGLEWSVDFDYDCVCAD